MRKITCMVLILMLSLTACGVTPPAEPADLTGNWLSEDTTQYAEVRDDTITIYWYDEEDGSMMLYWAGTYNQPTEPGDFTWTSINDREKTDWAMLASMDESKEFSYSDDTISYQAGLMGVTKIMKLKRFEE